MTNEQIEHIKELASQFFDVRDGTIVSPVDGYQDIEDELQRFAELIVKECAMIAMDNDITDTGATSDAIKKHFGVE